MKQLKLCMNGWMNTTNFATRGLCGGTFKSHKETAG